MLSSESSTLAHAFQNVQLLALSLIFLPIDTFLLLLSYALRPFFAFGVTAHRRHVRGTHSQYFEPKTVLVTGVGMTKGLALARLFYSAGHNVIGADFEPQYLPINAGHVSRALHAFYRLSKPDGSREGSLRYAQSILEVIRKEKVNLWVSCSGVASAVEDGQAKEMVELVTSCKAVQFDVSTTKKLHEKDSFIEYTKSLGLTVPDTHTITSRTAVLKIMEDSLVTGKKYILKFAGTDDAVRGDMTLLPFVSASETKAHLSKMHMSEERAWILQQFIDGPEYCTHSLVVRGQVKVFVACPSSDLLMHYEALPADSALSRAMLRFTQEYAAAGGKGFTGHLSFDFLVDRKDAAVAANDPSTAVTLYPIECNPRAHTAVALFNDTPEMINGYMDLLAEDAVPHGRTGIEYGLNGASPIPPIFPRRPAKYYWIGHDLVEFVLLPIRSVLYRDGTSLSEASKSLTTFLQHLIWWRDGTFEVWDPLPAWWLYHVYWPYQFLIALVTGTKWSRVNVSTCKMFGC